jgi:hypothetical protein
MIKGLVLLVSLGLGACSPELELLQNEVDVDAEDRLVLTLEEDVDDAWGKAASWGAFSQDLSWIDFRACRKLFPPSVAKQAKFNLGRCAATVGGKEMCELQGEYIGDTNGMTGQINFPCGDCQCPPNGGKISITRSLKPPLKKVVNFGVAKLEVSATCDITFSVTMTGRQVGSDIKLDISLALTGTMTVGVADAKLSGYLAGTVTIKGICSTRDCGVERVDVIVSVGVYVVILTVKFEVIISYGTNGEWSADFAELGNHVSAAFGHVSQGATDVANEISGHRRRRRTRRRRDRRRRTRRRRRRTYVPGVNVRGFR